MSRRTESELVGFDADRVVEAAREVVGDDLRAVVEYDEDSYRVLYLAEILKAALEPHGGFDETAERLHSYLHLDFMEREMFREVTPTAGAVRSHVTRLEHATFIRYLVDDEGIFLTVAPGVDLTALCAALDDAIYG